MEDCIHGKLTTHISKERGTHVPLKIGGNYYPDMNHLELIEAQLTKEGLLAYDSTQEASVAAYQELFLYKRREYFDTLLTQYSPEVLVNEPVDVNFCDPLMHMIATGQLFEAYFFHPDANLLDRRSESDYCLKQLKAWTDQIDRRNPPSKCNVDWNGLGGPLGFFFGSHLFE